MRHVCESLALSYIIYDLYKRLSWEVYNPTKTDSFDQ